MARMESIYLRIYRLLLGHRKTKKIKRTGTGFQADNYGHVEYYDAISVHM